jgi:hypothetical protein
MDIEEESQLAEYTDSHFVHQMNIAMMEQFRNRSNSNSPITLSNSSNSSSDDDIESAKFRKLTYKEVARSFDQYNSESDELDILITYLNGQKNLYLYSGKITQYKLHMLMLPIIVMTSSSTLIAPFIMGYKWSGAIISGMNAIVLFLTVLCNYFKLESAHNSFSLLSSQYSNLHASLTLGNSHYTTDYGYSEVMSDKIMEFERKTSEIRDSMNVPSEIKLVFPIISHINIFSFIKHIETYKRNLIIRYKDIKNEIRYIKQKGGEGERKKTRYAFLLGMKDKLKDEIIQHKNVYNEIETIFVQEIKKAETYKWYWLWIIMVGIRPTQYDTDSILYKHLIL